MFEILFVILIAYIAGIYLNGRSDDEDTGIESFADLMSQVDKYPPHIQAALLAYWEKKQ